LYQRATNTLIALLGVAIYLFGLSLGSSEPASAHHQLKNLDTSGLSIPNLTHGQLKVMTRYRTTILALAEKQISPDRETRTLQNFANLQFAYCLWGLVPGSVTEENNPFNACSHAYLAASKALLERLQTVGDDRVEANALAAQINSDMLQQHSALEICGNSVDPFNTASIILPEWFDVTFNPLIILLSIIVLGTATGLVIAGRRNQREAAVS